MIRVSEPIFGRGLAGDLPSDILRNAIVFTMEIPWGIVQPSLACSPFQVRYVGGMELSSVEKFVESLPDFEVAIGVGGGTSIDTAKFAAWKRDKRLILIPTILSTDAPFTKAIGVRVDGRVRYLGEVYPDPLLIDFDILQKSPKKLNRSGAGDVLSIYTALWDWKLASEKSSERYDEMIANESKKILQALADKAEEICENTELGLKTLAMLFKEEVLLCEIFGSSRPEEGSEHYFAYCIEYLTKKKFLHGELIAFSVILTSLYQGQDASMIKNVVKRLGIEHSPEAIGITEKEVIDTLVYLPKYLEEEKQLLYGIYHHKPPTEKEARELLEKLKDIL